MGISNHLVERFFQGDCTEEEKQLVMDFFRSHPEKLAQYLTEDGWTAFNVDSQQEAPADKMRQAIEASVGKMRTPVRRIGYRWAAVASIVALAALVFLLRRSGGDKTNDPANPGIAKAAPHQAVKEPILKTIDNNSLKTMVCFLPDGSKVELSGSSRLSFHRPFINNRRDIFLEGEAIFTVKKDRVKPFIVHSRGITTTALGTIFSVSNKKKLFASVRLFSGRIVVKKEGEEGGSFRDVYLVPGQLLILNKEDFSVQIRNIDTGTGKPPTSTAAPAPQQVLDFANKPLGEIFTLLQQEYNVSITYDQTALQNMTFTGKLNRGKESLESFLNTLCDLNELSLKKTSDNSYSIQVK